MQTNKNNNENNKTSLIRSIASVGALKLLSLPLSIVFSILLARGLGPDGYGKYVFILSLIAVLSLPFGPTISQLVTREIARYHQSNSWSLMRGIRRRSAQWIIIGTTILILFIGSMSAFKATWHDGDYWTLILIASILLPLNALNELRSSTLRGLRYTFHAQIPELFAKPSFNLVIASLLLITGLLTTATALLSQVMATIMSFILGGWLLQRYLPIESVKAQPEYNDNYWRKTMLPFALIATVGLLNTELGILALGWLSSNENVAALRVAQTGASIVALPLVIINSVIGPHVARAYQINDIKRLAELARKSVKLALLIAIPIAIPMIFFSEAVVRLIYGELYVATTTWPLTILATSQLINVIFGPVGLFLAMCGFEKDALYGQLVALFVNIIAVIALIPTMGALGASIAISTGLICWNIILAMQSKKRLGFSPLIFFGQINVK